jgi:hypothetical protein
VLGGGGGGGEGRVYPLTMRPSHHETVFRTVRVIQSSGPLTAIVGLLAIVMILILAVPILLIALGVGVLSLPVVLAHRALRSMRKPNQALDGRRNVRVIQRNDF